MGGSEGLDPVRRLGQEGDKSNGNNKKHVDGRRKLPCDFPPSVSGRVFDYQPRPNVSERSGGRACSRRSWENACVCFVPGVWV